MKIAIVVSVVVMLAGCASLREDIARNNREVANASTSRVVGFAADVNKFLLVGSESQAIELSKKSAAFSLKDPESAQFRNVRMVTYGGGKVVCGEINAKNSYGAYVGYTKFVAGTESSVFFEEDELISWALNAGIISACF